MLRDVSRCQDALALFSTLIKYWKKWKGDFNLKSLFMCFEVLKCFSVCGYVLLVWASLWITTQLFISLWISCGLTLYMSLHFLFGENPTCLQRVCVGTLCQRLAPLHLCFRCFSWCNLIVSVASVFLKYFLFLFYNIIASFSCTFSSDTTFQSLVQAVA